MKTTHKIIVIDLEATCWEGQPPKGQVNEIIEIGICMLDTATGDITGNKGILVRPERSAVSGFCTRLTTITPAMLAADGVPFDQACKGLRSTYEAQQYTWASYGAYDLKMMSAQCRMRNVDYPLSQDHINVKELFVQRRGLSRKLGMNGALEELGIPLEGTHHRGVDDARNIAKILWWCLQH